MKGRRKRTSQGLLYNTTQHQEDCFKYLALGGPIYSYFLPIGSSTVGEEVGVRISNNKGQGTGQEQSVAQVWEALSGLQGSEDVIRTTVCGLWAGAGGRIPPEKSFCLRKVTVCVQYLACLIPEERQRDQGKQQSGQYPASSMALPVPMRWLGSKLSLFKCKSPWQG